MAKTGGKRADPDYVLTNVSYKFVHKPFEDKFGNICRGVGFALPGGKIGNIIVRSSDVKELSGGSKYDVHVRGDYTVSLNEEDEYGQHKRIKMSAKDLVEQNNIAKREWLNRTNGGNTGADTEQRSVAGASTQPRSVAKNYKWYVFVALHDYSHNDDEGTFNSHRWSPSEKVDHSEIFMQRATSLAKAERVLYKKYNAPKWYYIGGACIRVLFSREFSNKEEASAFAEMIDKSFVENVCGVKRRRKSEELCEFSPQDSEDEYGN